MANFYNVSSIILRIYVEIDWDRVLLKRAIKICLTAVFHKLITKSPFFDIFEHVPASAVVFLRSTLCPYIRWVLSCTLKQLHGLLSSSVSSLSMRTFLSNSSLFYFLMRPEWRQSASVHMKMPFLEYFI